MARMSQGNARPTRISVRDMRSDAVHRLLVSPRGASALVAVVSTRAPVFAPEPGPRGLRARLATAALWFAMPVARSWGRLRGRRG